MKNIRYGLIVVGMLVCLATSAGAQVSIGIGLPNVSIGINLPVYPELVRVPGYPVYYAPGMAANYFFYDGLYWVYQNDTWYASSWYNGPWGYVQPEVVPLYILRIPVRYYREPPMYFRGWQSNAPPRWGQHWGHDWEQRRSGWNRWNRASAPAPAPLPVYQRNYTGDRYPRQVEHQRTLRDQNYRYQPRDKVIRQHFKQQDQRAPAPAQRGKQEAPGMKNPRQQEPQRPAPSQQRTPAAPHAQPQPQQRPGGDTTHKAVPVKPPAQQRSPAVQQQRQQPGATQPGKQDHQQMRSPKQQEAPRQAPPQQRAPVAPRQQQPHPGGENVQRPAPVHPSVQQRTPAAHEQRQQPGAAQEPRQDRGQGQRNDEGRGR